MGAFPWSKEAVVLSYETDAENTGNVCLHLGISETLYKRLNDQQVYIYRLKPDTFRWIQGEAVGRTYRSLESVKCLGCQHFSTIIEAIEILGGRVFKV